MHIFYFRTLQLAVKDFNDFFSKVNKLLKISRQMMDI